MRGFPSPGFARLAGQVGRRNRWANTPPEQRRAQMARVRAGQHARYVSKAAAMAAGRGLTPTPEQLETAADALRLGDLAEYRIRAWKALQGKGGAA